MMKIIAGFVLGAVGGVSGYYLVQSLAADESGKGDAAGSSKIAELESSLESWRDRTKRLQKKYDALELKYAEAKAMIPDPDDVVLGASSGEPEPGKENSDKKKDSGKQFLEAIMAMGAAAAQKEAGPKIAALADRLGLNDTQRKGAEEAMAALLKQRQEAGLKMMSGKATFADLRLADDDNFDPLDKAMSEILSGDEQREEYETYQQEREVQRIEGKVKEDMQGLANAGLDESQQASASELFYELNANRQEPENMEGVTMDDFNSYMDAEINTRVEGLRPILTDEQMGTYQTNIEGFRAMITGIVAAGTGNAIPARQE